MDDGTLTDDDLAGLPMAAYLVGQYDAAVRALRRCFQTRTAAGLRSRTAAAAYAYEHGPA